MDGWIDGWMVGCMDAPVTEQQSSQNIGSIFSFNLI